MLVVIRVPVLNLHQCFFTAYLEQVVLCGECVHNTDFARLLAQLADHEVLVLHPAQTTRVNTRTTAGPPAPPTFHQGSPKSVRQLVTGSDGGT